MTKRRQAKFLDEFANAIDVIVRGVKSGLPLNECLRIIARESPSPIREEFRELVEQQRVGVPLSECFDAHDGADAAARGQLLRDRDRASSSRPAATSPRRSATSSGVLRDRKTAGRRRSRRCRPKPRRRPCVLGALPFIVMTMVYMSTPKYIALLFTTKIGQLPAAVRGGLDDVRHPRHAQDDQLQVLTVGAGRTAVRMRATGRGCCHDRFRRICS